MTCDRARAILPELIDSRTEGTAHVEARAHLANCPACQREFADLTRTVNALDAMPALPPPPRVRQNFYAMLEQEKLAVSPARPVVERPASRRPSWWRRVLSPLAGCALLALGFVVGKNAVPVTSAPSPREVAKPATATDDSTRRELVALREQIDRQQQQLEKMTTLVGYSILQQQQNPANERLKDVLAAARAENVSDKILDDLIQALTLDPNANVRLRALEALYPHAERATVRAGVLAALPREQNPLVQLELIDFVATSQNHDATPLLEHISTDETANGTVREAAKIALAQL
jgi:hypothetical protein